MASETEIFALEASVYQDIVIDKGNGYVYNNFDSLKEGIKLFLSDELPTTYKKEKAIANENTLKNVGKKLIEIYKGI
jgi:glycosyltransferase involved in cell wall biosynthesis